MNANKLDMLGFKIEDVPAFREALTAWSQI
jgi:hypothetical protein